jgi:hypothetical protein
MHSHLEKEKSIYQDRACVGGLWRGTSAHGKQTMHVFTSLLYELLGC